MGQQGWEFVQALGMHLVFRFVGGDFDQYATIIRAEWQQNLPGMLKQLGNEGWSYLGKGASHFVFKPGNRIYKIVERSEYMTDFNTFLSDASRLLYVGSSDSYLFIAEEYYDLMSR